MKFKQHLPNYIRKFVDDPRWRRKESAHYIFHFFSDSLAEKEIVTIIEQQEKSWRKILDFLELPEPSRKIIYYLYPDGKTKKQLMGDDWFAQSIRDEFCVHMIYNEKIKPLSEHEDTHLLSLSWGFSIGLLQEGLAEYLVGHSWHGENLDQLVVEAMSKKLLPSIESIMDHKGWLESNDKYAQYNYAFVGSFARFLIEKYGKEKFRELYQETTRQNSKEQNISVFKETYGITPSEVETIWKKSLGL